MIFPITGSKESSYAQIDISLCSIGYICNVFHIML